MKTQETKHTPGPLAGNDAFGWYIQWHGGQVRSAMPDRESAILTAAAPELLQALESFYREAKARDAFVENDIACINARAAIAKATGE